MSFEKQSTLKTVKYKLIAWLLLGASLNLLFWHESFGLNVVLYLMFCLGLMIITRPVRVDLIGKLSILALISSGAAVMFVNSVFSMWICSMCALSTIPLLVSPSLISHNFTLVALVQMLPSGFHRLARSLSIAVQGGWMKKVSGVRGAILIPTSLILVFFSLYVLSNEKLEHYTDEAILVLDSWFGIFFQDLSFDWFLLLIFGCIVALTILFGKSKKLNEKEIPIRMEENPAQARQHIGFREWQIAIVSFASLNVLLFLVNAIDISWIWIGFDPADVDNLSSFVHEGTYVLIFSILLSMGVVLYFFKGGLNFFRPGPAQILAWLWLLQNAVLAVSVAFRNYHYIAANHAITYKRIGVFVFLLFVIIGLISLFLKLKHKWRVYKILQVNVMAVFIGFNLLAWCNWDEWIVRYNLRNPVKAHIEYEYLLSLSDKVLDDLLLHRDQMNYDTLNSHYYRNEYGSMQVFLDTRIMKYHQRVEGKSWLSWNLPDHQLSKNIGDE